MAGDTLGASGQMTQGEPDAYNLSLVQISTLQHLQARPPLLSS